MERNLIRGVMVAGLLASSAISCGPQTPDMADTIKMKCDNLPESNPGGSFIYEEVLVSTEGSVDLGDNEIKVISPGVWNIPVITQDYILFPEGQDIIVKDAYPLAWRNMFFRVESRVFGDKTSIRVAYDCKNPQNPPEFPSPESNRKSIPHHLSYKGFGMNR